MTNKEAKKIIYNQWQAFLDDNIDYAGISEAYKMAIKALEQTDKVEESNFDPEQYKADLQAAYDCGYNSGYADAMNDISESEE